MAEPQVHEILLQKAAADETASRGLSELPGITDDIIGFHVQQAIEKRLKAVLASRGIEYPFTHDLRRLCALIEEAGITLPAPAMDLNAYTPFAAITRYEYPLDLPVLERPAALALLERTRSWAAAQVQDRSRP